MPVPRQKYTHDTPKRSWYTPRDVTSLLSSTARRFKVSGFFALFVVAFSPGVVFAGILLIAYLPCDHVPVLGLANRLTALIQEIHNNQEIHTKVYCRVPIFLGHNFVTVNCHHRVRPAEAVLHDHVRSMITCEATCAIGRVKSKDKILKTLQNKQTTLLLPPPQKKKSLGKCGPLLYSTYTESFSAQHFLHLYR